MRFAACVLAGVLLGFLVTKIPWFRLMWDEPATPPDWKPRFRYWVNGEEVT